MKSEKEYLQYYGMDDITDGKILYWGTEISRYRERQMAKLRSHEFGFVFQQTHLVSNLSLLENVAVAGYLDARECLLPLCMISCIMKKIGKGLKYACGT